MRAAIDRCSANLELGLGQSGDDSVLLRSFSALVLDALAARDIERAFLGEAERHALVLAALAYLEGERDLRGYDPERGWIHAAAHTADLLRRLSRNPALCAADQDAILAAIEHAGLDEIPIDVWVDADSLLRRLDASVSRTGGGSFSASKLSVELFDYGEPVVVTRPPASEVAQLGELHPHG